MIKCFFILLLLQANFGHAQCKINSVFIDSSGAIMRSDTVVGLCVKYKARRKKLIVRVGGETVDIYEILKVHKTSEYISLMLFCETDDLLLTTFRFYLNEVKKETILVDSYSLFETGSGIAYRIGKRIKGTGKKLPSPYLEPPM
jgi:hypothetical protein